MVIVHERIYISKLQFYGRMHLVSLNHARELFNDPQATT